MNTKQVRSRYMQCWQRAVPPRNPSAVSPWEPVETDADAWELWAQVQGAKWRLVEFPGAMVDRDGFRMLKGGYNHYDRMILRTKGAPDMPDNWEPIRVAYAFFRDRGYEVAWDFRSPAETHDQDYGGQFP